MRIKYTGFLLSDTTAQLRRFPLPEPPTDAEMATELAGIARLEEALNEKPVPFSEPSLEPSYNELMLERQARRRKKR